MRLHLESYRDQARIMGVIEQVSRYDADVMAARAKQHRYYLHQVEQSIRRLQRHGMVDTGLDPAIAATALGAMTNRFPEAWLVQGFLDCSFEDGVEQLTRVFMNAPGLKDDPDPPRPPARTRRPRKGDDYARRPDQ